MLNRHVWNSYWRLDPSCRWEWVANGCSFGDSHGWALCRTAGGEVVTLFGRQLPER